jgi:ankyrin repeat protein
MKLKIYLTLLLLIFVAACESRVDAPPDPEMTKNMLKLRGYNFTEDDFFKAIRQNDRTAIGGFFDAGMNPNVKNRRGETALTFAITNAGTQPGVELSTVKLIADKADINMQDGFGQSPLHLALSKEKEDIFNYLLEKNADVNVGGAKDTLKNQTALYLAVTRGREDLTQKLLERGADPNIADSDGSLALAEAMIGASLNENIVKMLLDKGAKVNQPEGNGMTPLMYIAENDKAPVEKRTAVAKMLLDAGADKTIKDKKGKTALDWAKEKKNAEIAAMLR